MTEASNQVNTDQLKHLFEEIGTELSFAQEMIHELGDEIINDPRGLYTSCWAAETFIQKVGWLADIGCRALGGIEQKGGAEAWFCSPAYLETLDEKEQNDEC